MAETASETGIEGRIVNVSSLAHSWVKRDVLPPLQNLLKPHKYKITHDLFTPLDSNLPLISLLIAECCTQVVRSNTSVRVL